MRSAVFLGPSLDPAAAARALEARFLPPVRRGDLDALLADGVPEAIGIVDGRFFQSLAISPKEVLRAIDAGCRVYGASSMGALRAVELAPYGMIGVGRIYEMYRDEIIDADDEVAMIYDATSLRALSVPLVNMRVCFAAAVCAGVISPGEAEFSIAAARELYYPERTYRAVLEAVGGRLGSDKQAALKAYVSARAPDAKREDALHMLAVMRDDLSADP
jgi:hypothetical protein